MDKGDKKARGKLSLGECALFCEQVALILSAGIPLYDGVETLSDGFEETRNREAFSALAAAMRASGSLYEAVRDSRLFPGYLTGMVRIGEQTGKLESVMRAMAAYYTREDAIRRSIRQAVAYPLGLLAMMAVVIAVLVARVMPIFERVYAGLGAGMSASTSAVVRFGIVAGEIALIAVGVLLLVVLAVVLLLRSAKRGPVLRWLTKWLPGMRGVVSHMVASRLSSALSMMLASGYPLEASVRMLPEVFSESLRSDAVDRLLREMESGAGFADAVEKAGIFDKLHVKMLRMGVQAGQTDQVLDRLAGLYQEQFDDEVSSLVGMIEPTMVALLSVVIGAILLSVMLPLAGIMTSIG